MSGRHAVVALIFSAVLGTSEEAWSDDFESALDPPPPPSLPSLTHAALLAWFDYTGAVIELNPEDSGLLAFDAPVDDFAFAWFAHAGVELPIVPRQWFLGFKSDVSAAFVPGLGNAIFLGNPEITGRGMWWSQQGLSSGGELGIVIPAPRNTDQRSLEILETAGVVRPWDYSAFLDRALTLRPSFDVRYLADRLVLQLRQGVDWSYDFGSESADLVGRATLYAGVRVSEPVGLGIEAWEVYQLTADVPDEERAAISLSPTLQLHYPPMHPSLSLLIPLATPLRGEAASYLGLRLQIRVAVNGEDEKPRDGPVE